MKNRPIKQLTVFKASAGSGKTFTLAVEYIKLLINNPYCYDKILAVTFTNKATEEMKHRILSQLYGISLNLPDSADYIDKVCADLNITQEECSKKASVALQLLLHNYNFFRVQTIDTFFQSVMRNLARELNLSNNLRVSLNDDQVISQAVDSLMESLNDKPQLMSWVEEFVRDNMDDNKPWNISTDVKKFSKNITKELYKSNKHLLENIFKDKNYFDKLKKDLSDRKRSLDTKYVKTGQEYFEILKRECIEIGDFSNGSRGIASYFNKLKNGDFCKDNIINETLKNHLLSSDAWFTQNSKKKDHLKPIVDSVLLPLLKKTEDQRKKDVYEYRSILLTLQNMNKLRLLHNIEEEIKLQNGEHSRFLLSDTQTLLYEMIKDDKNIAPFIYEKIGTFLSHIMIDEFQDTSNVQWQNFKVLLDNCMGEPVFRETETRNITNNLIVGDVKQSIYRFRSGDWTLLNNIDKEYGEQQLFIDSLETNYRSERNIINFNNAFFATAAQLEADRIMPEDTDKQKEKKENEHLTDELSAKKAKWANDIRKAYLNVAQKVPEKKKDTGFVKVHIMPNSQKKDNEAIINCLLENIRELLKKDVPQNEIAILVRRKSEIAVIADKLSKDAPEIKLISQEAFRLDSSPAVCMLILAMRLIANPSDNKTFASLAKAYQNYVLKESELSNKVFIDTQSYSAEILPKELNNEVALSYLSTLPLNEMVESLIRILNIQDILGQEIYISTLSDKLNAFAEDNIAEINEFLTYWDEELCKKTVEMGSIDGIRIMTIHKSKGLEFDHVLIPFCNWGINPPGGQDLWCKSSKDIPFVPVEYRTDNSLKNSIYETEGSYETMQNIVDNLNLLYVAFTRAGKSLIVITDLTYNKAGLNDDYRATLILNTLLKIKDKLGGEFIEATDDDQPTTFTYGQFVKKEAKEKKSSNVFEKNVVNIFTPIYSNKNNNVIFKQSNKSRDFADDITDEDDSRRFIRMGTILHQLFSSIRTEDDIPHVLANMEFEGLLYDEEISAETLQRNLAKKFENPVVKDWFSDRWQVFNECTLLYFDEEEGKIIDRRPDRVITDGQETIVIDYKFGKPDKEYEIQVRNYMNRLGEMGHQNVKGFLWYVNRNIIESV